jgi:hypothetical protein
VDSNLLLLLFIGEFQRDLIAKFKRLNSFTPTDYDTLKAVLGQLGKIVTTPNILTEVSNLSGELRDQIKSAYYGTFAQTLTVLSETYIRSIDVAQTPIFRALGITDAGIALIAREGLLVLTEDLTLCQYLLGNGIDALNFNHVRSWSEA